MAKSIVCIVLVFLNFAAACQENWKNQAIIYGAVAQVWGDDGFKTVDSKLEYIKDLGVDVVWLWPPVCKRAQGEEYGIVDYFSIDPSWGSRAELRGLVRHAHRLGLRVMIDFVPNHTSDKHPFYLDTRKKGRASRYYDYYDREPNGAPKYYFDYANLPNLNYDNECVRRMMINAIGYWIREYDIDGYRMDMAWAVQERCPDFWVECRKELKRIKPDLLLLAEASAEDANLFNCRFDVAYDWRGGPGKWAWEGAFEDQNTIGERMESILATDTKSYSRQARVLRFINNNDTGERYITRYGLGTTKVAAAMEFTLPGVSLIFGGDEIGAQYEPYSDLPPVLSGDKYNLRKWYKQLIRIRDGSAAIRCGDLVMLKSEPKSVVSYIRTAGKCSVIVVLNYGKACKAKIELSEFDGPFATSGIAQDMLDGKNVFGISGNCTVLPMDSNSVRILVPSPAGN